METSCQNLQTIKCSIPTILERIEPIDYVDNTLVVNSQISVEKSITIGDAEISILNNQLNLPEKTLINGVPLISDAFTNDVISLPTNTIINGYSPTIEQYFYFFMSSASASDLNPNPNGYIINGRVETVSAPTVDLRGFPFIAPEDCVLTSFQVVYIVMPGASQGTPPRNGYISLDIVDSNLNPFFTGISYTIVGPTADSRTFLESQFEYYLKKGDSVGVYVKGASQSNLVGIFVYATLGYRIIPPALLTTSSAEIASFRYLSSFQSSVYHRFPFNDIMNLRSQFPITFEDQLEKVRMSKNFHSEELYGRVLTSQDYEQRSNITIPQYQSQMVLFFTQEKQNGWFIDFSSTFENTKRLEKDYGWKGLFFGMESTTEFSSRYHNYQNLKTGDYQELFRHYQLPFFLDYLSLDEQDMEQQNKLFDYLIPIFTHYSFAVITVRHNANPNIQSKIGNVLVFYNYTRIFSNVQSYNETNEWIPMEDWYVHTSFLHPSMTQWIQEHSDNKDILPETCLEILYG